MQRAAARLGVNDDAPPEFPPMRTAPNLRETSDNTNWRVDGIIPTESIVLLSGLPKAGKSTWLSWLLASLMSGDSFCGRRVAPAKEVLIVTEESENDWAKRRNRFGYDERFSFMCKPWWVKPSHEYWREFIDHLAGIATMSEADTVIIDTISGLWPVREENNAGEVTEALTPLNQLAKGRAIILGHHLSKADGGEGKGARGSGALVAFPDVLLELRRFAPEDRNDSKRAITGLGRPDDLIDELVIELTDDGYKAIGDRRHANLQKARDAIGSVLTTDPPGMTAKEIDEALPEGSSVRRADLYAALSQGVYDRHLGMTGTGKKNDPKRYFLDSFHSVPSGSGTEPKDCVPEFPIPVGNSDTNREPNRGTKKRMRFPMDGNANGEVDLDTIKANLRANP